MDSSEKRKSISGKKLFLIAYICVFGFRVLFDLISELSTGGEDLPVFWMVVIADALSAFIFVSPFWLIVKSVKKADKKVKKESMSKIDFVNSKEYYRDILRKYSPAELSYIDDFNIDYPKDIIATLLSLKLKNKITITNNYVNVVDFNAIGLRKSEIYVLDNIKDGKVVLKNSLDIIKYTEDDALEDNLIVKANFNTKKTILKSIIGTILKFLLFMLIFGFVCLNIEKLNYVNISDDIMFILVLIFGFFMMFLFISIPFSFVKIVSYLLIKSNSYKRTNIGEEINEKIEGLKNYIKDFSILNEREQQELMIWEDYLIYSILFNQNQKIFDELSNLVEAEYEVGKVYFEPVDKNSSNNTDV